jgi:hypothetical protein
MEGARSLANQAAARGSVATPTRDTGKIRYAGRTLAVAGILFLSGWVPTTSLHAQFTLFEGEENSVELGGYFQSLTGLYDQGYHLPGTERLSGFNAEVLRLKWTLRVGDGAVVEIHDRLQTQTSSATSGFGGSAAGFGVSVVPGRTVDLSSDIVDESRLKAWHDVDRLALTLYTDLGDVTVGRQAITWGISSLFPVADLWAQFSPFELDTEEKPGIDAVRILSYPSDGLEIDAVVADRGVAEDLSAGIRAGLSLPWADLYFGGGKLWNEAMILSGVSAPVGTWKLRAEGVLPYDLDDEEVDLPRMTLGIDRLGGEFMLSGEYHFNGVGEERPSEYGQVLEDPRFTRGESYYLGRHYLGAVGLWTPGNDRLSLTVSAMANLQDSSTMFTPIITYDFGQETRMSLGGLVSFGNPPEVEAVPNFRSEYGAYGDLFFTRVSIYF